MRAAINVRPQQSHAQSFFSVPTQVLELLNRRAATYGAACNLGKRAAEALADCLLDERHLVGAGLLSAISLHLATADCSHGVAVGFYAEIDRLILRASNSVCFPIQRPSTAEEAHERGH